MSHKRLWLGFASLIVTHIALSNIATAIGAQSITAITIQSIVVFFFAAIAGGFVARQRFVLVALAAWLVLWAAIGYMLYLIAAPTGHASISSIVQHNWVAVLLSGVATILGVHLGQAWANSRVRQAAAT